MKLPLTWKLPEDITERLGERGAGRQRAMAADGHLLLVLHKLPARGSEREAVFFWRKPDGEWVYDGEGIGGLRDHIEEYSAAEERFSQDYDRAEDAEDYFRLLENMAPVHHAAKSLHATMQAAREAIPDDRDIIDLRDATYDLERDLDLLYADAKNAVDFNIAKKAEEEARLSLQSVRNTHRLNIFAAVFFPLAVITSVFGMNLPSGFEEASTSVFWLILLLGIALGLAAGAWVFKGGQGGEHKD